MFTKVYLLIFNIAHTDSAGDVTQCHVYFIKLHFKCTID